MKTITINKKEIPVYCTVEEANQYFAEKFGAELWEEQTEENKARLLVTATRKLSKLKLKGFPCDQTQPLLFPRYFKPNFLSKRTYTSEVHAVTVYGKSLVYIEQSEEMLFACCEEAFSLINRNEDSIHIKNQKLGIQSTSIMGNSVSYTGYGAAEAVQLCPEALACVDMYLIKVAKVV